MAFDHIHRVPVLTVVAVALTVGVAWAGGNPRAHDGGFFLRLSAGGGGATTEFTDTDGKNKLSGGCGNANFAIGGIVSENLAVHGTLWGWLVSDPNLEVNGQDFNTSNVDLSMSAIGAGVTYYVMPANLYFSGSLGIATMTLDVGGLSLETDPGFAADLTVGKEWWVGDNWGLGVAGTLGVHSIGLGDNTDEKSSGTNLGLRFTATLN